ncbi:MAG: Mut7-C RNAse domain-containing protein [Gammaproteobacteria bacterium]
MASAHFRFYEELNDFLPPGQRKVGFEYAFAGRPAIKDVIEALSVPHTEVDLILMNGESVDFSAPLMDGARVSGYPMFEALDITRVSRVRSRPLRASRFVLDTHLGRLARYLRLLGFDTWYRNDYDDAELARICQSEQRILLTRDRELLKRSVVTHG